MREDLHRSPQQVYKRQLASSRRTEARRRFVYRKVRQWLKRNHPEVLERLRQDANRKFPNPCGRKARFRIAA